jgi:uncharacterized protein (DUF1697 family)
MKHVALLRGINVGGNNKLAMKDLAAMFTDAGCGDVCTYIQSGNVVFSAPAALVKTLPGLITQRIAEHAGHQIPIVLRTAGQIAETLRNNPFLGMGAPEKLLYVYFLADVPGTEALSRLDPNRSPQDKFHVHGRDIYVHLFAGAANTKLSNAYFDSKLKTVSTARNWTTVRKLAAMLED